MNPVTWTSSLHPTLGGSCNGSDMLWSEASFRLGLKLLLVSGHTADPNHADVEISFYSVPSFTPLSSFMFICFFFSTRSHWCNSVMSCEARLCPSSLLDVLLNCSKPAADDIVGVSHIRAVLVFFKWITFCFLFCCLASSNWPSSMWRCDEEGPRPHVPLLLILHFLLILILFHSGLWFGNLFLHFPPLLCTWNDHPLVFPICCPKMFELLPSILILPHVPDMSDLPLMLRKSL